MRVGSLRRGLFTVVALLASQGAVDASAAGEPDSDGATTTGAATGTGGPRSSATCVEQLPEGKSRPKLVERFPGRGLAGHVAWLEVDIEHGQAEKVMPGGLTPSLASEEASHLKSAGFVLADPEGSVQPRLVSEPRGDRLLTHLSIPVVPLPDEPGRRELELPSLPVAISRASGDLVTLCSRPHAIVVEEPIANDPNPKPRANPPPERQLEPWEAARWVALVAAVTLLVAALLALILWKLGLLQWLRRAMQRRKPEQPPRPPWETALEELFDIRHAGLVSAGRFAEHYDRVSDTVRKYLGDRYGFDGLESTTREVMQRLRRVSPRMPALGEVEAFLRDADLVKFARLTPTEYQCDQALIEAESIISATRPTTTPTGAAGTGVDEPEDTREPSGDSRERAPQREDHLQ